MIFTDYDWSEIIFDLKRAGMDHTQIARAAGFRETTIRQYMAGATPMHWRGEQMLRLWCSRTGKDRDQAPTRPAPVSHVVRRDRQALRRTGE